MLFILGLLFLQVFQRLAVDVLRYHSIFYGLDNQIVDRQESLVRCLLLAVGIYHESSRNHGAVCVVAKTERGNDDAGVQVVVVWFGVELQVVAPSTLHRGL